METATVARRTRRTTTSSPKLFVSAPEGYMNVEESRRLTLENVDRIYKENGLL